MRVFKVQMRLSIRQMAIAFYLKNQEDSMDRVYKPPKIILDDIREELTKFGMENVESGVNHWDTADIVIIDEIEKIFKERNI